MSRRAIDRFRPQPPARLQSPSQGHPTAHDRPELAANPPVQPDPSNPEWAIATNDGLVHQVFIEPESHAVEPAAVESEAVEPEAIDSPLPPTPWFTGAKRQFAQGARVIGMPLIWVGVAAFCGGTGYAAFNWLSTIPPVPECDRLWFFSPDSDKLFCAEQAARSGKVEALQAGIKLVEQWGANHQLHAQASRLHREWSKRVLQIATQTALDNDLDGAIKLAKTLPAGNPVHPEAQKAVAEWQKLRDRGQTIAGAIEAALKAQDWQGAEAELQPQKDMTDYQRQELNRLRERLMTERMAANQRQQVRELVKPGASAETLKQAIQLASQINLSTYVGVGVKSDIQQWSNALIELARTRLQSSDVNGAIALIHWLPATVELPADMQDLVWISRAQSIPPYRVEQPPANTQWQYTTTLAALKQIQPVSPLYPLAQTQITTLEQRLQDLTQLNLARLVATSPHIPTLRTAIAMAQTITPDRPQRIPAQTLIAKWRKEIERVQDRPILMQAKKLAAGGNIKNLQAAIAQASKVPLGRALRPEAQAAIFDWQSRIQTVEDKPILDQARQLAKQDKLPQAIGEANKITPGRALHSEAQAAVRLWTTTIQTAEDRPILDEAKTLATQGNFRTAIDVASQIAPGRALYDEAQKSVAEWTAQLPARRRRYDDWSAGGDRVSQPYDSPRRWRDSAPDSQR